MGAPYNPPTKNASFETYVSLRSFATPGSIQANPTLAAGDVKLYIDGVASTLGAGSTANLITLPTVVGTTVVVKVVLGSTEMNADNVTVVFIDQTSPEEWEDLVINIVPGTGGGGGGASAADIADAVWDEALSGHTTGGTAGKALSDIDGHTDTETGATAIRAALGLATANLDTQLDALPTAAENAAGLLDLANGVTTGRTVRQAMRAMAAALWGKANRAATTTMHYRNEADDKNVITATVDSDGNRTAVTLDVS